MFEKPEDKVRERAFAKQISEAFGVTAVERPEYSKTDYLFVDKSRDIRFIGELKTAFSIYSQASFPLSVRKHKHILEIAYREMCNAFLFVKFLDGKISWLPIASPSGNTECWTTSTVVPLRDPRQRPGNLYDNEPGFRIPRRLFYVS
jgi:hypothetical protein